MPFCSCQPPVCDNQILTLCNGYGQSLQVECPESCGENSMGSIDCLCAEGLNEIGLCDPSGDVLVCQAGVSQGFDCPETCAVKEMPGLLGSFLRATCTCADVPDEGQCLDSKSVACPYGYRVEVDCSNGCGWIMDASLEDGVKGCLCDGVEKAFACDGGDVLICKENNSIERMSCAMIMPGTNHCVELDIGDQNPAEAQPFNCILVEEEPDAGSVDPDGESTVDSDGDSNVDAGTTIEQDPSPNGNGGGCGCGHHGSDASGLLLGLFLMLGLIPLRTAYNSAGPR
jgi:hypothetical protein